MTESIQQDPRRRITKTFVKNVRREGLRNQELDDVQAEHLLVVAHLIKDDYNSAINYAKGHGFDLETLHYSRSSGVLHSNWDQMVASLRKWGGRFEFVNLDKPLSMTPASGSRTKVKKTEADRAAYAT